MPSTRRSDAASHARWWRRTCACGNSCWYCDDGSCGLASATEIDVFGSWPAVDGLAFEAFSAEYIANILESRARPLPEPGPLQLTRCHDLLDIDIPPPDLTVYDGGSRDAE
jgi:hypothetical protein